MFNIFGANFKIPVIKIIKHYRFFITIDIIAREVGLF